MLFVIDFDGTLARTDTVDAMLEKFAVRAWQDVEQDWLHGNITAVDCMRNQIRMVDSDCFTLENYFRSIALDDAFLPFYRHVSSFAAVAIVSDGLDHAIQIATRHAGLPKIPVFANHLLFLRQGIDIAFPHLNPQCKAGNGVCKCAVARKLAEQEGGPIVLIGDGKSDACLARSADIVFAKSRLLAQCLEEGIAHIPFADFGDVLATVRTWRSPLPRRAVSLA